VSRRSRKALFLRISLRAARWRLRWHADVQQVVGSRAAQLDFLVKFYDLTLSMLRCYSRSCTLGQAWVMVDNLLGGRGCSGSAWEGFGDKSEAQSAETVNHSLERPTCWRRSTWAWGIGPPWAGTSCGWDPRGGK